MYAFHGCTGLTSIFLPNDLSVSSNVNIPTTTNQVKYSLDTANNKVKITGITLGEGKTLVEIPATICGYPVKKVETDTFNSCTSLKNIFIPAGMDVTGAGIPDTTTQVKYTVNNGEVTITGITLEKDNIPVEIPATICGYPVVAVASDYQELVDKSKCNHVKVEATCITEEKCALCGQVFRGIDSSNHDLENIPSKDATITETGNTEYWQCKNCKKYFADEKGTNEISLEDTVIQKLPPEIIKGKGQSVAEGEKKALSFTSNAAYSDFIRVELDGKTLDAKNYTVKEGSTIVTLKADYVATLSAGKHTIGIVSKSGTAETTFTVNAKSAVAKASNSPQTGDNSHMVLWIAVLLVSGGALIVTMVVSKKRKRSAR